ncbi:signal peptidase I [Streptomyces sp. NPDC092296]|uniref:signal peptidase I n=1 Tax=Streptomyces sp. NPDC092296 TaxID=3366012 RepID=UPI0037FB9608
MSRTAARTTGAAPGGAARSPAPTGPAARPHGPGAVLQGVAIAIGLVLMVGGFALIAVEYRPYRVPTDSMNPTIHPGDTVLARKSDGADVGRGDVVVFKDAAWGDSLLVKRVVAVGGDTLVCCDSRQRLAVDGVAVDEPYLPKGSVNGSFSVKVPTGRLFLMGDNRLTSLDSREHLDRLSGTVPASDVVGRVAGTVWPASQLGVLDRTAAFDPVGAPRAAGPGPLAAASYASVAGALLILVTAAIGPIDGLLRRRRGGPAR